MKVIIAISIAVITLLFFTRYDLYESEDSFSNSYVVVEKGFYLQESCISKGEQLDKPYKCIGYNTWSEFRKKNHNYKQERDVQY
ncbi:hypothetical protein G8770_16655 [Aestuariicella hydrocarbonica]|uniref:Uncharacterized protein n=1 Tax=Pseudomaricurvus hydrocarbonicus TaxID=1470433 RepID=A0A9E5MMW4_9GAMM|nr:hypothetical protein [Aestuariicella hydrocarbonica]NHO67181.1 hypothetical protein [Aestuariicella hydrocarbonica]